MDIFRGLAILSVVLTHVQSPLAFHELVRNGTVFFIFISGFFFAHLYREEVTATAFWSKKIKRVILPYLISTIPGVLTLCRLYGFDVDFIIRTVATGVGHRNDPHWFIPFIALVFLFYPILRILQRNGRLLFWSTIVCLLVGVFTFRAAYNANPLINFVHFVGVFPAGMLWHRHRARLEAWGETYGARIVSYAFLVFLGLWVMSILTPFHTMEHVLAERMLAVNYNFLGKLVLIPVILVVLKRATDAGWQCRSLKYLGSASFGLFFWHGYAVWFILRMKLFGSATSDLQQMLFVGIEFILVVSVVLVFLRVVRKLVGPRSVMITGY